MTSLVSGRFKRHWALRLKLTMGSAAYCDKSGGADTLNWLVNNLLRLHLAIISQNPGTALYAASAAASVADRCARAVEILGGGILSHLYQQNFSNPIQHSIPLFITRIMQEATLLEVRFNIMCNKHISVGIQYEQRLPQLWQVPYSSTSRAEPLDQKWSSPFSACSRATA
jgi:hypothetical protein